MKLFYQTFGSPKAFTSIGSDGTECTFLRVLLVATFSNVLTSFFSYLRKLSSPFTVCDLNFHSKIVRRNFGMFLGYGILPNFSVFLREVLFHAYKLLVSSVLSSREN